MARKTASMDLGAAVPELPVADVGSAQAYYRDVLHFTVAWRDDDANITDALATKPWGMRQFTVRDTNGHLFHFHCDVA